MRRFVRKGVLLLAAAAAVFGATCLADALDSHGAATVEAAVAVADDLAWT